MVSGNHKLTAQQEHFAQLLFQGKDQAEAKRLAYPKCNLTGNALYVNASRLANLAKIRLRVNVRVNELRNAAVTPLVADIVERKQHATGVMRNEKVPVREQLSANKLIGEYEKELGSSQPPAAGGDTYNIQVNVTNQLTLMMAEAEAHFPGILQWMEERMKALEEGDGG